MWELSACGFGFAWLFVVLGWTASLVVVIWAVVRMFPTGSAPHSRAARTQNEEKDSSQSPKHNEMPKASP